MKKQHNRIKIIYKSQQQQQKKSFGHKIRNIHTKNGKKPNGVFFSTKKLSPSYKVH